MTKYDFDLFTLGAGSGGVAGSRRAAAYGARVGIAEESRVGGTCVLRGCVPKKLLVYGARFADDFADAAGYGWTVPDPVFDWPTLIRNKDHELDRLHAVYLKLLADSGVRLFDGRARLVDRHTIEIGGERVTTERVMIATGGHPVVPDIPGIEHVISSNEALSLPALPRRIAIVGGGYIALEFASIFNNLDVEVSLVCRGDAVLRGFDHDIRSCVGAALRERGIALRTHTHVTRIETSSDGLVLVTQEGDPVVADTVLYATGRRPNTRGLGLDAAGVELGAHGAVPVDDWSETNVPGIYAVGDVTDRLNLTPVAIAEARAIAETHYNGNPTKLDRSCIPTAVFSIPPVGTVGLSEEEARAAGHAVDVYRSRFRPMKHTLSGRDERTMMKLVVDRATDRVLGCHMVGDDAPEITQGLAIALKCGATKKQFDQTVGIHPTAAEEFVTMREKVSE
ncbi:MAG TPA: glutathione-disulfide reductase [Stellaceae bacterium]|nr:glutathione-disulfide reductase [Stellaceae bacterium]